MEDLGYSTLYMPDHFVDCQLAPMPPSAVAARTRHLRGARSCSTTTTSIRRSSPRRWRRSTTHDGRCELGIGAGWMKTTTTLWVSLRLPGVRIARLDEALQ